MAVRLDFIFYILAILSIIRNSSLLLIKRLTKSTLLKSKIQASPNDLGLRQAEMRMCLWLQKKHQQYRSSFTNESVERIRKGKYEYLSFLWRNKADSSTDIAWDGGTSYQDNSIGKMHKVQERRCAMPCSFENRDWLPYVIDSHA